MQTNKEVDKITHGSDIGMINPGFNDQRSYTVHNDDCIIVLSSHSEYEIIASMPCRKIFAGKKMINRKYSFAIFDDVPITFIPINSDIIFSTICAHKYKCRRSSGSYISS